MPWEMLRPISQPLHSVHSQTAVGESWRGGGEKTAGELAREGSVISMFIVLHLIELFKAV